MGILGSSLCLLISPTHHGATSFLRELTDSCSSGSIVCCIISYICDILDKTFHLRLEGVDGDLLGRSISIAFLVSSPSFSERLEILLFELGYLLPCIVYGWVEL